mmetsp:Transcript_25988/g.35881  ORF Transcript_25988/g.35881 Transcript_25988/m.35881 type:complete len:412 (+) Transcript_25988:145-1380(+)
MKTALLLLLVVSVLACAVSQNEKISTANQDICPGSSSYIHAKCSLSVVFQTSCDQVRTEMMGRMSSHFTGWQDPHNGGQYSITSADSAFQVIQGEHITGNGRYTDKLKFKLEETKDGQCTLHGCSESQVFSVLDFSTNFCNLYNLYCNSGDGCKTIDFDLRRKSTNYGSCMSRDAKQCITKDTETPTRKVDAIDQESGVLSTCPQVQTQQNFNLTSYIAGKWFVQQQMATEYLPQSWNYCVQAEYTLIPGGPTFFGYTIQVHNYAQESDGTVHSTGSTLCAVSDPDAKDPAKLLVAPCFLPTLFAGPYWVLAYNEEDGYALISGGQPTIQTPEGTCKTGTGQTNSGLWIFTRTQERDDNVVTQVRKIAVSQGFDLTVLKDVQQKGCPKEKIPPPQAESRQSVVTSIREYFS